MTDQAQATRVTPAGWYQDPAASEKVRWWNGLNWTDNTADKPSTQGSADARKLERELGFSGDNPAAAAPSRPTAVPAAAAAPVSARRTATGGAWLLAFMPIFVQIVGAAAGYVYFYVAPTPLVAIAAVVLWLLGFLWAHSDARALEARGITAPNPAWALIGAIVYLALRRTKVSGWGPIAVFLILTLVSMAGIGFGVLRDGGSLFSTALNIQLTLHRELVDTGKLTSVSCPPIIESTSAGKLFTCTGTAPDGSTKNIWVSFDNDQGDFSYAIDIRG